MVLTYGGSRRGIRGYSARGRNRFGLLGNARVSRFRLGERFAYAIQGRRLTTFSPRSGNEVARGRSTFRGQLLPTP